MWRGNLIFVGVSIAVLALSQMFWWIAAPGFDSNLAVRHVHDQATAATLAGPLSPWPEWAAVPNAKRVIPRHWEAMLGFGQVEFDGEAYASREAVAEQLRQKGMTVKFWRQPLAEPFSPSVPVIACMMRASHPGPPERVLHIRFMPSSTATVAEAYWFHSIVKQIEVGSPEAC